MSHKGRPAKPGTIKEKTGNPGKRPIPAEPRPRSTMPPMPRGLSPGVKAFWKKYARPLNELGLLTELDVPAFLTMATHYVIAAEARSEILTRGVLIPSARDDGAMVKNPATTVLSQSSASFRHYAIQFGLTPSSRVGLGKEEDEPETFADKLRSTAAEILRGVQ